MKRLIAAGVLIIVISIIHLSGNIYIKNVIKETDVLLQKCIEEYKNEQHPEKAAKQLKEYWGDREGYLSVFAHHDDIDKIELAIDTLSVYSKTENSEIFYEYSGTVKTLLHQLKEDNSLSMHSIL